jgi:predicted ATPase
MPGVGKSVLAVRAAHQVRGAYPDGQLFADLGSSRGEPADPAAVLGDFLRAAGVPGRQLPAALAERARLFRSWTAGRQLLIVLDDAMSGSQVQPLLPADAGCRVLVTSRRSMTELAGVHPVELGPMDCGEGLELLGNMVGRPRVSRDLAAAREVVRMCDGLPLAIRAAGTMLASAHAWPLAKMAARLGGSVALLDELSLCGFDILGSFESSYRWLPAPDQGVFRLLSLLGDREFTAAWAALLLGCDPAAAQAHLARLVECHLLGLGCQDPSGELRYRFHELARIYARARLGDVLDPALAVPACHLASRSGPGMQPRIA